MNATAYPYNIVAVAALLRERANDPVCVVRWALGDAGTELPRPDDIFDVEVMIDGAVVETLQVSPMNYAMLDPGRIEHSFPDPGAARVWMVANQPTAPIDPAAADSGDLTRSPVGVVHLLRPTATARLRVRGACMLYQAFEQVAAAVPALSTLSRDEMAESAILFADALIHANVPASHLPTLLRTEFDALRKGRTDGALLAIPGKLVRSYAHAALVTQALALPFTIKQLAAVVDESMQVRSHIRYAALSGGTMIDYWNDPMNTGAAPDEGARGKVWPSSELLGLGCRITLKASAIEAALAANPKTELIVRVTHRDRQFTVSDPATLGADGLFTADEIFLEEDLITYQSFDAPPLNHAHLKRALKLGSSHPPQRPADAYIDWGMLRVTLAKSAGADAPESSIGFRTGDSKIEIVIKKPAPVPFAGDDERTNTAYNVYGVWEGAPGFDAYFADPNKQPTLDELRPWLMTRRYSYTKDLQLAFPDLNGAPHPALHAEMARPAWHSLVLRPQVLEDKTTPNVTPLPDANVDGDAVFTFDLRTAVGLPPAERGPSGWDMSAPMNMHWRPELDRDLQPVKAQPARAQRYRFWVTAVDPFEQESEPLPVRAEDKDAGEKPTWLYAPRRRTPLLPPPADNLRCVFDAAGNRLKVTFSTPSESQASGQDTGKRIRVNSATLNSTVVLFRRLLVLDKKAPAFAIAANGLPKDPKWDAFAAELAPERWRFFGSVQLNAPHQGDDWESSAFPIGKDDFGWEYLAAVNFTVKPAFASVWAPSVPLAPGGGRSLTLVAPDTTGKYVHARVKIDEMPSVSAIAKAPACLLSDTKDPWWPEVNANVIHHAKPVLAPPQTRRDLILQRLLDRAFANGTRPEPLVPWGETMLTVGQAAMARAALERTISQNSQLPAADSEALASVRRLLARDLTDPGSNQLRQHATIGFRGLVELTWTYTPRSKRPVTDQGKHAEAAAFRIYGVSVPAIEAESERYATVAGNLSLVSGQTYRLAVDKGGDAQWKTVGTRPTMLVVRTSTGTPVVANVVRAFEQGGERRLELSAMGGTALPASARARLFAAQPIDEVLSDGVDAVSTYRYFLPIPGGPAAWFAWWVSGVSSTGKEAQAANLSPMRFELLPRSVEPPAPSSLYAFQPTDNDIHFLDPAKWAAWMPSEVRTLRDAKYFPRTVLAWAPPEADPVDKLKLIVERRERAVAKPPSATMLSSPSGWEAIKRIENLADGAAIDVGDLAAIAPWLSGEPVEAPAQPADGDVWRMVPLEKALPLSGALDVPVDMLGPQQLAGTKLPGWVDYFGRNKNQNDVMDGNWDYQYRLRTVLDLEIGGGEQGYLLSPATPWSSFVLPDTPSIRIKFSTPVSQELSLPKAQVRFVFSAPLTTLMRAMLSNAATQRTWEYRIVVRRKLLSPSITEAADPWIDVGQPLSISFTSARVAEALFIVDDEVDRRWPGDVPQLTYRVLVQQFLRTNDGRGAVEKLIRAYDSKNNDIQIALVAPRSPHNEVEMVQTQEIT